MSIKTQHTRLEVLDRSVSPNTYMAVACITGIQGPNGSRQVIDATCLDSTFREKDVGIPDAGQLTFGVIISTESTDYHVTESDSLWTSFKDGVLRGWKVVIPTSPEDYFSFSAYVLNFAWDIQLDSIYKGNITLEISGTLSDSFGP